MLWLLRIFWRLTTCGCFDKKFWTRRHFGQSIKEDFSFSNQDVTWENCSYLRSPVALVNNCDLEKTVLNLLVDDFLTLWHVGCMNLDKLPRFSLFKNISFSALFKIKLYSWNDNHFCAYCVQKTKRRFIHIHGWSALWWNFAELRNTCWVFEVVAARSLRIGLKIEVF